MVVHGMSIDEDTLQTWIWFPYHRCFLVVDSYPANLPCDASTHREAMPNNPGTLAEQHLVPPQRLHQKDYDCSYTDFVHQVLRMLLKPDHSRITALKVEYNHKYDRSHPLLETVLMTVNGKHAVANEYFRFYHPSYSAIVHHH